MPRQKQSFVFNTIRAELTCWFLLLALVPLVIVSSIGYWQARVSLIESATEQLKQQSESKKLFINNWFDYRWMDLNRLVDTELNVQFLAELKQKMIVSNQSPSEFINTYTWTKVTQSYQGDLVKLSRRYDYIYDIFLIDLEGNILFSVAKENDLGANLISGNYSNTLFSTAVKRTLTTGESVFSDFEHYSPSDGLEAGFIAAPLIDQNGERIGAVSIQIRLDRIQKAFNVLTKQDTLHYLTASDGKLRTVIDDKNELLVRNISTGQAGVLSEFDIQQGVVQTVESYIGARGNKVFGISKLVKVWNIDWILVSEIDQEAALASANWLGKFVLFSLFITVLLISYLAFIVSRKLTRPIRVLAEATELMANGKLDKPVILNANNEMGRLVDAFNNMMTSRRIHEEEILREKSKAEQASNAKSEFLACMSHEIRTPMNGVLGMISLTLSDGVNSEQKRKLLIAQSSAQSLLTLINDILDYSKIEAGKLELEILDFNLSELLGDIATASALKTNEHGVELILDIGQINPDLMVKGDPSRLRQILVNLLGNANKFTLKGEVILRANIKEVDDSLRLTCEVSDTGIGIPEDKIAHLFDSFSQVDASTTRKFGGTGLGLAICLQLVKLTGGEIRVKSEYGVGSTFEFDMLLKPSAVKPAQITVGTVLNANILILDDNHTNREIFRSQIEGWGGRVTDTSSVDDALAICSSGKHFDAVIVDLQMPGKSGIDFAIAVKVAVREIPALNNMKLLLLSSVDEPEKLSKLKELGFSASLTKPVTPSDLYKCLSYVLNENTESHDPQLLITPTYLLTLKSSQQEDLDKIPNWKPNVRILLVEDNQINQEVVKGLLSQFNLECEFANNGFEALDCLLHAQNNTPYTLVLMDCQMPEMDGYEATRSIRAGKAGESYKNVPIVAMTANAMQGDKEKCIDAGMNDYLSKPLNPESVFATLLKWLEHSQQIKAETKEALRSPIQVAELKNTGQLRLSENLKTFDLHHPLPDIANNPKLYLKLLTMYVEDSQKYAENLLQQVSDSDISGVRNVVHLIKGVSGNLGIVKVHQFAGYIEASIIEKDKIPSDGPEKFVKLLEQSFQDIAIIIKENSQYLS